jgi:hypothetical protein
MRTFAELLQDPANALERLEELHLHSSARRPAPVSPPSSPAPPDRPSEVGIDHLSRFGSRWKGSEHNSTPSAAAELAGAAAAPPRLAAALPSLVKAAVRREPSAPFELPDPRIVARSSAKGEMHPWTPDEDESLVTHMREYAGNLCLAVDALNGSLRRGLPSRSIADCVNRLHAYRLKAEREAELATAATLVGEGPSEARPNQPSVSVHTTPASSRHFPGSIGAESSMSSTTSPATSLRLHAQASGHPIHLASVSRGVRVHIVMPPPF